MLSILFTYKLQQKNVPMKMWLGLQKRDVWAQTTSHHIICHSLSIVTEYLWCMAFKIMPLDEDSKFHDHRCSKKLMIYKSLKKSSNFMYPHALSLFSQTIMGSLAFNRLDCYVWYNEWMYISSVEGGFSLHRAWNVLR